MCIRDSHKGIRHAGDGAGQARALSGLEQYHGDQENRGRHVHNAQNQLGDIHAASSFRPRMGHHSSIRYGLWAQLSRAAFKRGFYRSTFPRRFQAFFRISQPLRTIQMCIRDRSGGHRAGGYRPGRHGRRGHRHGERRDDQPRHERPAAPPEGGLRGGSGDALTCWTAQILGLIGSCLLYTSPAEWNGSVP